MKVALDSIMQREKLAEDMTVFRGGFLPTGLVPGDTFNDPGFTTSTIDRALARSYTSEGGDSILFSVKVHKGDHVALINPTQTEYLFERNSTFKYRRIQDGIPTFELVNPVPKGDKKQKTYLNTLRNEALQQKKAQGGEGEYYTGQLESIDWLLKWVGQDPEVYGNVLTSLYAKLEQSDPEMHNYLQGRIDAIESYLNANYPAFKYKADDSWIRRVGGLPSYIKEVADGMERDHAYDENKAVKIAIAEVKKWASGESIDLAVLVKSHAAIAEWEAKKNAIRRRTNETTIDISSELEKLIAKQYPELIRS
jgi:hypothetical protein